MGNEVAAGNTTRSPCPPALGRDRYIDTLRVVALIRVMTYHTFGSPWLPVLYPSIGVMFALAGGLVAASLDRRPTQTWKVLLKRLRRLLPPLWIYGAIVVPVMIYQGWNVTDDAGTPLTVTSALLWVLPLYNPPGSLRGEDFVSPLWYITTYLWSLLLSPVMLWLFRRFAPAALLFARHRHGSNVSPPGHG